VFGGIAAMLAGAKTELIYGFFGAAAIVGVVFIWKRFNYAAKMKQIEADAKEKDKQREHEIFVLQMKSTMDRNLQTVTVTPVSSAEKPATETAPQLV
jgi:hypothetical protein